MQTTQSQDGPLPARTGPLDSAADAPAAAGKGTLNVLGSAATLTAVFDALPATIYVLSPGGQVEFASAQWREYARGPGDDAARTPAPFVQLIHPDDLDRVRSAVMSGRAAGAPYEAEMRLRAADGTYRWHLSRTIPLPQNDQLSAEADGAGSGWVGINIDIDDRKRREISSEFLAEAGRLLAATLDVNETLAQITRLAVPGLADWCRINLVDASGILRLVAFSNADPERMQLAGDVQSRLAGLATGQETASSRVLRTGVSELIEDVGPLLDEMMKRMPALQPVGHFGFRSVLTVAIPHGDRRLGTITLATAESGRRLTDQDRLVAEQFGLLTGLAIENARLYRGMEQTASELAAASSAKDDFLAMVSHELRTPLTILRGTSGVVRRWREFLSNQELDACLRDIDSAGERLHAIVENMLVLAHTEGVTNHVEPVLVGRVTKAAAAEHSARFPDTTVAVQIDPGLPPVAAVESYTRQILDNLLGNARKYGGPSASTEIRVVQGAEHQALISVSDRGIGVSAEQLDKIFDTFYRAAEGVATADGMGLGLAVCKRLVEYQGGRIWAEAREGGGTTVSFTLPFVRDPEV